MREHQYFVYIMASKSRVLYTGVTNDLQRRVFEHKDGSGSKFTRKYNVHRLVYYEAHQNVDLAIQREKQIKGWVRRKKVELIENFNPNWEDLSEQL